MSMFVIVDPDTGRRVSVAAFLTVDSAERHLAWWKERDRPDIPQAVLDRLEIRSL
jgi:hypothetical protein